MTVPASARRLVVLLAAGAAALALSACGGSGRTGGSGRVSTSGLAFEVTRTGKAVYSTGNEGFYHQFTNTAGIRLLDGLRLKVPVTDRRFGRFSGLTHMTGMLGQLLHPSGTVTKVGTRTIGEQRVIGLRDPANGGILYVAARASPSRSQS